MKEAQSVSVIREEGWEHLYNSQCDVCVCVGVCVCVWPKWCMRCLIYRKHNGGTSAMKLLQSRCSFLPCLVTLSQLKSTSMNETVN